MTAPEVAAPVAIVPYWSYWVVPLATVVVGAGQAIVLALINKKVNTVVTEVEKVHVAVNSERTAMTNEVRELRNVILRLSEEKARSEQKITDAQTT